MLWHLRPSHYNEKARWALDYKGIPHVRREARPGQHPKVARELAGGRTFPVLVLDGEAIGDSTRILEALERFRPDPPLFPVEPAERRRALEIEDYFDEEFAPYLRGLLFHHMIPHADLTLRVLAPSLSGLQRRRALAMFPLIRRRLRGGYVAVDDEGAEAAFAKIAAAGRRFREELEPSGYLVGDRFTVADLAVAALSAPVVAPEQFPYPQPQRGHPLFADLRDALAEHGLDEWTREMYARHRGRSAEVVA